ncbi:hypothetical protein PUN28_002810 [Cardiocondyla obscurior]|uniref:Uncharacterized protein n=1 Tax=Cardiocondyla obscurior TaxID=286306 RepID=A0AAW2GWH1_9HYME
MSHQHETKTNVLSLPQSIRRVDQGLSRRRRSIILILGGRFTKLWLSCCSIITAFKIIFRVEVGISSVWKAILGPPSPTSQHPERRSRPRKGILLRRSSLRIIIFWKCSPPIEMNKRIAGDSSVVSRLS